MIANDIMDLWCIYYVGCVKILFSDLHMFHILRCANSARLFTFLSGGLYFSVIKIIY